MDKFLIALGVLAATICGMGIPLLTILFGNVLQAFSDDNASNLNITLTANSTTAITNDTWVQLQPSNNLRRETNAFGWQLTLLGCAIWILSYFFVGCLNYAAERQVFKIRNEFLKAVLRQDVGWYDTTTTNDFASKMTE